MNDDILNLEQAMAFFGVSERTLIKMLREEKLPARKIGREWRFSKTALLQWLGSGNSLDYLNQAELYRVAEDEKAEIGLLLKRIATSLEILNSRHNSIKAILPEISEDVALPAIATLRTSYKKQRDIEKLTFKIFWLSKEQ